MRNQYSGIRTNPKKIKQKKSDQLSFMDRIIWQYVAKNIRRTPTPFEEPGNPQDYEPYLKNTSNQVLLEVKQLKNNSKYPKKSFTYFVPTYIRLVIKNFTNIDLTQLQAEANVSIMITFVYGNEGLLKLPQQVAARLYNEVVLNFQRNESLRLTHENENISVKQKQEKNEITFTVRCKVHMRIEPDIFYTPFQKLNVVLPITIQQLPSKIMFDPPINKRPLQRDPNTYEANVKFNFMDRPNTKLITIDFKGETNFGNYSLIENSLCAQYTDKAIKSMRQQQIGKQKKSIQRANGQNYLTDTEKGKNKKEKSNNFQYASFQATLYKQPLASIVNIFLPLWGLALINIIIYYQEPNLAQRIASIATLMVAFIALVDNIRTQIPPHPKLLFVEYLVYAEILFSIFCLIHSFGLRRLPEDKPHKFGFFQIITLSSAIVMLITQFLLVIGRTYYHYIVQVPNFSLSKQEEEWKHYDGKNRFDHVYWKNPKCDQDFYKMIELNKQNVILYNSEWTKKLQEIGNDVNKKQEKPKQLLRITPPIRK